MCVVGCVLCVDVDVGGFEFCVEGCEMIDCDLRVGGYVWMLVIEL